MQTAGADPGFPLKGVLMYKSVGVRFADFISLGVPLNPMNRVSSEPPPPLDPPLNS